LASAAFVLAKELRDVVPSQPPRIDLGLTYCETEIKRALSTAGFVSQVEHEKIEDEDAFVDLVADALVEHQPVAWFQGRSEFGPRALGFRSILLNPADARANFVANEIKGREPWRPSAISILAESASKYIEGIGRARVPYMAVGFSLTAFGQTRIKAGRHAADGTTRPQTVSRSQQPLFWKLLKRMEERTGTPVLLNTSFNREEPIVESPGEALNTFVRMKEVSLLAIGRFLVRKKPMAALETSVGNRRIEWRRGPSDRCFTETE
jgi:carbamoyltransferase